VKRPARLIVVRPELTDREKWHAAKDVEDGTFASLPHAEAFRLEVRDDPSLLRRYMLARANGTSY
jgi:hypothetical protein